MRYNALFCLLLWATVAKATPLDTVIARPGTASFIQGKAIQLLEDKNGSLSFQEVQSASFQENQRQVANLNVSRSTFWLRFSVKNLTPFDSVLLRIPYPTLDSVTCFYLRGDGTYSASEIGQSIPFYRRRFRTQDILFQIPLPRDSSSVIYLKVKSKGPILVPVYVGTTASILFELGRDSMIFGI
jgi:hypothetical protein